jgi:toxin-antitoxin system PIN domain toxin
LDWSRVLIPDINMLVYAHREEMPHHPAARQWLEQVLEQGSPFGVPDLVFAGFVRLVTQRPFDPVTPLQTAFDFCRTIMRAPGYVRVTTGERHWELFESLCCRCHVQGADTTDAFLAAIALERGAVWVTFDHDFRQYPGLTWRNLLHNQTATNPL